MSNPNKYVRLNNEEDTANETVTETIQRRPISEMFSFEDRPKKKCKKSKKRKKLVKELRREKKRRKKISKSFKEVKKEIDIVKQDVKCLKKAGYDNKLNELIACNDPAERKRIAAELKRIEV